MFVNKYASGHLAYTFQLTNFVVEVLRRDTCQKIQDDFYKFSHKDGVTSLTSQNKGGAELVSLAGSAFLLC